MWKIYNVNVNAQKELANEFTDLSLHSICVFVAAATTTTATSVRRRIWGKKRLAGKIHGKYYRTNSYEIYEV